MVPDRVPSRALVHAHGHRLEVRAIFNGLGSLIPTITNTRIETRQLED
jgi:hypothetical protein